MDTRVNLLKKKRFSKTIISAASYIRKCTTNRYQSTKDDCIHPHVSDKLKQFDLDPVEDLAENEVKNHFNQNCRVQTKTERDYMKIKLW